MSGQTILLTRPQAQSEQLAARLKNLGHTVYICPMLEIEKCSYAPVNFETYDAIILTSQNALEVSKLETSKPVFCVGQALQVQLKEQSCTNIIMAPTAKDLADEIEKSAYRSFMYLRGEDIRHDLKAALPGKHIEECIVYKAHTLQDIPEDIQALLQEGGIDVALFFSVRTGQAFTEAIQSAGLTDTLKRTKALCLSAPVLESVSVLPWKDSKAAAHPDTDSLLSLLYIRACMLGRTA